jgi:hypothetical protein
MNVPGFTAKAAIYQSAERYRGSPRSTIRQGTEPRVLPASRRVAYCSMKGCCIDLRRLGFPRICCNGDECGPDVLI